MSQHTIGNWFKQTAVQWVTRDRRGYTGQIDLASNVYTLTITGTGAPVPAGYATYKKAKEAFRKFIRTKSPT